MMFVTGDTHGDYTRFNTACFPEQKEMTKEDYVIICGDFGLWNNSNESKYWLNWLDSKPFTTLFVDGNHENYDLLATFPVDTWNGGEVQFIRPSVLHLMRGQLFELCGKRIFTMGGASSHDIHDGILDLYAPNCKKQKAQMEKQGKWMYRVKHFSWWEAELPSEAEYVQARATLARCDYKVDYIITHCAPNSVMDEVSDGLYQPDALTNFLEEVRQQCTFAYWFFGHYHQNRHINKKYVLLYDQIIELP